MNRTINILFEDAFDGHEFYSKRASEVEIIRCRLDLNVGRLKIFEFIVAALSAILTVEKPILKNYPIREHVVGLSDGWQHFSICR